ncbi:ATP-binding cassette domain-containing protein [Virgibacillus sp. W0430]|uniref:ATP-binding cassette domain-containing protein n=1 Tax=Virgibacillus sp. W0430 TaxID=3391580 RepID=UPI003F476547
MLTVQIKKKMAHFTLDVQFQMGEEIVALFGPSGSGKTTILNSIAGLIKIDDGEIRLNDVPLVAHGKSIIPIHKRNIGYFFQDYALFPHKTVWGNITYGMKNEQLGKRVMKQLSIEHLQDRYPHEISGGEKQRVALARALATEPELLLLDEPFSALDGKARMKAHEELIRLHTQWQIPILLVTHDLTEARKLASRIVYIQSGKNVIAVDRLNKNVVRQSLD